MKDYPYSSATKDSDFQKYVSENTSTHINLCEHLKKEEENIFYTHVVQKLQSKSTFTPNDEEILSKFMLSHIYKCDTNINLIKTPPKKVYELFNQIVNADSYHSYIEKQKLIKKPDGHLENLFSIVKHCQEPDKYPINYPQWGNMNEHCQWSTVGLSEYDRLCYLYNNVGIPDIPKHVYFAAYMDYLAHQLMRIIAPTINSYRKTKLYNIFKTYKKEIDTLLNGNYNNNFDLNSKTSDHSQPTMETTVNNTETLLSHPLNLILYGPPGTGKTYNTLFRALAIIEGKKIETLKDEEKEQDEKWKNDTNTPKKEKSGYELLKSRFDDYVKNGQIVFTTFHQSMSYEDFIEGIKPVVEDDEMTYQVQDGIFKKICELASEDYSVSDFDSCYDQFVSGLSGQYKLKSLKGSDFYIDANSKGNLTLYTTEKQNKNGVLTKENIKQTYLGKTDYWKGYMMGVVNHLKDQYGLKEPQKIKERWNYVLIIDEINRGNVSQIFGELISLIEDSKRLGNSESMTATLPYSQDKFGVPNNLYIIGTMNTADRSVEALDTALRRRFSFEEMMPKPKLLKDELCGVKLSDLLTTINKRIVVLKDREHQIGHSYFMRVKTESDLKNVFKDKIIPLLQEYFYGDYKKIYYVLGEEFVTPVDAEKKEEIFSVKIEEDDFFDIPEKSYKINTIDNDFDINRAINLLMGENIDSANEKSDMENQKEENNKVINE